MGKKTFQILQTLSFKYFKLKVPTDGLNPNTFLKLIHKKGGAIGDLNIMTKVFI